MKVKYILLKILVVTLILLPVKVFSQDTLQLYIDISNCTDSRIEDQQIEGELGLYAFTFPSNNYGKPVDTLVQHIELLDEQKLVLPKNFQYFKLKYIPSDTLTKKVEAPLDYFYLLDKKLTIDCYFFRKSISHIDYMNDGDTLCYITEYRGPLVGGATAPRSALRIVKIEGNYFYSRNDLPMHGNPGPIYMGMEYEEGYSELKELSTVQLEELRDFEREIIESVMYSLDYGYSEVSIKTKEKTYRFIWNVTTNNNFLSIWKS